MSETDKKKVTRSQKTRPYDQYASICKRLDMDPNDVAELIGYSGVGTASGWLKNGVVPEVALNAARGMLDERSKSGEKTILLIGDHSNAETLVKVAEGLGFRAAVL